MTFVQTFAETFDRAFAKKENGNVLFLHELHEVVGAKEAAFESAGSHYAHEIEQRDRAGSAMLRIEASFRTSFGSHRRREVVLWQKITDPKALLGLLTREIPARYKQPGGWMNDALALRDQWRSKLLRTSAWSPWH